MEDIYTIVDKAIDVAFEEQKFHLKIFDYLIYRGWEKDKIFKKLNELK